MRDRLNDWSIGIVATAVRVQMLVHRHPRRLAAGALLGLSGLAATAVAIAPLVPDASRLERQVVVESVQVQDIAGQIEALADHPLDLFRSEVTRANDSADSLLARLGVTDGQAAAFIRQDKTARRLVDGRAGKMIRARADSSGRLLEMVARYPAESSDLAATHFTRVTLKRGNAQATHNTTAWLALRETVPLESTTRLASGTISTSLFAATDEALIPESVASQMAEVFAGDVDFHRELKRGDSFSLVYETLTADGDPITWNQGAGRVLAAEFVNNGRAHQAIWFSDASPGGRGGYYDLSGKSRRRAFLASPMEFSRVTSGFALRFHPILHETRAHLGVDYGAPQGTPARAVADGVVEHAGWQNNGYGNVVLVKHSPDKSTLYAHLSRIDVKRGERVSQGQRIGAVGATGLATGPHLHFEFRVKGRHVDPLKVARQSENPPLSASSRAAFADRVQAYRAKLDVAATMAGNSARGE